MKIRRKKPSKRIKNENKTGRKDKSREKVRAKLKTHADKTNCLLFPPNQQQ